MINLIITACVFAAVWYHWPTIEAFIVWLWHFITCTSPRPHHKPGEQRNNLDLFGKIDVSKTKDIFEDDKL